MGKTIPLDGRLHAKDLSSHDALPSPDAFFCSCDARDVRDDSSNCFSQNFRQLVLPLFKSRDSAGSVPNNIIAKARRLIELKITILRDHQLEPVSCSLPRPWAMFLQHWLRNIQLLRTFFEHSFPAHNPGELPRSRKLAGLVESQLLVIGFQRHTPESFLCVELDFAVSFHVIASFLFSRPNAFRNSGYSVCLESTTHEYLFCLTCGVGKRWRYSTECSQKTFASINLWCSQNPSCVEWCPTLVIGLFVFPPFSTSSTYTNRNNPGR